MNISCTYLAFLFFISHLLHCHLTASIQAHIKSPYESTLEFSLDLPDDFGKTHFIVGYPAEALLKEQQKSKKKDSLCDESFGLICDGKIKQVFFSPDDGIRNVLLYLIGQEKKSIRLTAFSFTDGDIAQALIDAMARGVNIELVVDPGFTQDRFTKITLLLENGLDVFVYDPDYKKNKKKAFYSSIMHHKFILFTKNILDKSIIWTGSFNFTKSAHQKNHENVIVLDDEHVIKKFEQHFELLKTRAHAPKKKRAHRTLAKNKTLNKKGTVFEDMLGIT